jgi:hypothetical protein
MEDLKTDLLNPFNFVDKILVKLLQVNHIRNELLNMQIIEDYCLLG